MRNTFIKTLSECAKKDKRIFLVNGDLGYNVLEPFARAFPDRYINIGVAEQNMIGVSAGLALSGKVVYAYSIIPFATMRCFEQIRNDVCMQRANVRVVGVGGGFAYGQAGPTHHSIQDIAIMRTLPGMAVVAPSDPLEVSRVIEDSVLREGPMYIRLTKNGEPDIHDKNFEFQIGKAITMKKGTHAAIVACGNLVRTALEVAGALSRDGLNVAVIDMHTIKPFDTASILNIAREVKSIVSLEEHSVIGGLGSAVAEAIAGNRIYLPFKSFGIGDMDARVVGSQEYLQKLNRLTEDTLAEDIKDFISKNVSEV
ncbi:MAG: hypothetical protein A3H69_01970 [Candidatus Sungbacteria bacterium RIFCSPLOWO2_02_FULL_47_9]|uniref:Transketolase-like pyrimidine-binding domain-containing protein n=1 Tax=Candidatus Sungbacteria bacterium RIFCSPHIGHO2_01_FULL_47_32 TaxID=1802264 RepID=A0A1G2K9G7_9BACT|nr:MAG: Transketolase subunit B [Parcubacteria group bacterium GW2011_GWA2_47_10]OGZ95120.1 MAG: hypothetical protein A2633_06325 [Candidatus Sungbacteria bacterium RIFCSPHIGHO2_01_FULL_47_32]OGZ98194.1 MAG: hypothetical protein A3D57_03190 [Candidatus Sungbacteria bacterium RIFCSPHIGHO2_02_FULL_46_12]OHA05601.1 MAG: hypothetical protein A3A28_00320 [Candidatus Sungbacteria bacterium RIFCSPLOWO2_01_FULL_47_32]OHA12273.1 MAG: hypothetical protein A3H69_01970 [Candidatus Sungbacteria bacterium RI